MTDDELLLRWKTLAGDTSATTWDDVSVGMLFQKFRPHGDGVDAVFEGLEGGDELLERLLPVYQWTAEGFATESAIDAYFVVRHPPRTAHLADYLRRHLEKMAEITQDCGRNDLSDILRRIHTINEVEGERPPPDSDDTLDTEIYEVVGDWFLELTPMRSKALLLHEAYYTIACDYDLASYLMWPLYRDSTNIVDPFAPYFELWRHGASIQFEPENGATIYVSHS
ncbi:MAG TPA: hypothetical protein P5081_17570 [Phycisphaerae bacterium]|nr:hypothetical protein [Phycisphaerae bacterium]HRW54682.1 hypothetical protein [Phycisphaerae bacterium]